MKTFLKYAIGYPSLGLALICAGLVLLFQGLGTVFLWVADNLGAYL